MGLVAEQEGIPGPITDYDMGFKDGVEEILGLDVKTKKRSEHDKKKEKGS